MKIYAITALSDNFQMAFATIFQVVLSYFLNFYRKLARTIVPQIVVRRWYRSVDLTYKAWHFYQNYTIKYKTNFKIGLCCFIFLTRYNVFYSENVSVSKAEDRPLLTKY